jgi:hypothetical protein
MARWDEAQVTEAKVLGYLLSADHPTGADKAAFFRAAGYTRSKWTRLRDDLLDLARQGDVGAEEKTTYGVKYVVDGLVKSPTGRTVRLRTVWISDGPDEAPRLVTAYPRRGAPGDVQGT